MTPPPVSSSRAVSSENTILGPPAEARNDPEFLADNGYRILMLGNPTFAAAVKAIHDSLKHLREGGALEELSAAQAPGELLRAVNRTDEFMALQEEFMPD